MKSLSALTILGFVLLASSLGAGDAPKAASPPAAQPWPAGAPAPSPSDLKEAALKQAEAAKTLGVEKESALDLGNNAAIKLALIPAGKFLMGSPKDEKGRKENEGPQHEVSIARAFYMGIYPLTQQQYQQVTGKNPSGFKGPSNPVEMMSWDDAVAFCTALSKKTGKVVRLPTEAEWEYACRAGSATQFFFGDDETKLGDYAWFASNSGKTTHPVGQKKPNAWGLYDMSGNVWQWCSDWIGADYYANSPKDDPQGPASGVFRVLRGGSWPSDAGVCRSAIRSQNVPAHTVGKIGSFGFRVVVETEKKSP